MPSDLGKFLELRGDEVVHPQSPWDIADVNGSVVEVEYVPFGSTLGLEVGSGSFKLDPRGVEITVEHSTCGSQQPSRRM